MDDPLIIDFNQAERFLTTLDEEAEKFTFQTFDDDKTRMEKRKHLSRVFNGTFDSVKDELTRLNNLGAGVFVTYNQTDLKGREAKNIIKPRAVIIEDDNGGAPNPEGLEHHIVISSSGGHKQHRYFLIDSEIGEIDHTEWRRVQERLVLEYFSDPQAKDLARVLRLPGFYHQKDLTNPIMVNIIHESGELPYSWDKIKQHIPPLEPKEAQPPVEPGNGKKLPEIRSALALIDPDCEYGEWIAVGMAVHTSSNGGPDGMNLWDEWSKGELSEQHQGLKYPTYQAAQAMAYKWQSFHTMGNETGIVTEKSIFDKAYKAGWKGLPVPDKIEMSKTIVEDAYLQLDSDIAAMYQPVVIEALAFIKQHDDMEYERIYHSLKKYRIAVEIRNKILFFQNKNLFSNNTALQAHPALTGYTEDNIKHSSSTVTAFKGKLTTLNSKTGEIQLIIESKAALILAYELKQILGYSSIANTWHKFTGTHWQELSGKKDTAEQLLQEWLYIGCEPIGFRPAYQKNIMSLLADGRQLPLPDNKSNLLPFENGLLDIETNTLIKTTPQNAQTWVLPYQYTPNSDCQKTKYWLNQVTNGDAETVEFLRAWLAALLHGRADLHKFLHLLGGGGSGKSTFARLAVALMGEHNAAPTSLNKMETNQFETSNYYEKRIIVITDSDAYGGSVDTLKAITGQDTVRMERKYEQGGKFTFDGLVLMVSNQAIVTSDHTSGLERRRLTVNFDYSFTEQEKIDFNKSGGEKAMLHTELPGLVNWLLELSQDDITKLMRNPPKGTIEANIEAKKADNSVFAWLLDCCVPDKESATQIGKKIEIRESGHEVQYDNNDKWLYPNYLQWCSRESRTPLSVRKFSDNSLDTLKTHGVQAKKTRASEGRFIAGIRLNKEWEAEKAINEAWETYLY